MATKRPTGNPFARTHCRAAYRSGLEAALSLALTGLGISFAYEAVKVPFTQPEKSRTYSPDFILRNGVVVETKGLFDAADRQKHLWVKAQHPDLDIRFVFSSEKAKLSKGSATTYADWCKKNGYKFSTKTIPPEWLTEAPNTASLAKLTKLGYKP